jgi:glucose-6-phosphate 1-epimerase
MHGFARLMYWDVLEVKAQKTGETTVRLQLCSSEKTKAYWDYEFCAEMTIVIGKELSTTLKITNNSSEPFEYSAALHSYFNLSSLGNISIEGLQNTKFHDQLEQNDSIQQSPTLEILKAETRHYYDTEATCTINDSIYGRRISVAKTGSKITTVWNPGEETCIAIDDLPDDAFHIFICVEAVNAFNNTINLAPGEVHETSTTIGLQE